VTDLQAASQAATAARSSKHDTSADFAAMSSELQSAIKRAHDAEQELLRSRAEAKAAAAVAAASTAPATGVQGAQQASKSLQDGARSAADDQALSVYAESQRVALDQRNTLHKAEADPYPAANAAGPDGANAESAGWKASGGGALAAVGLSPNSNPSHSQTSELTLPFLQAPSWKQSVIRARKAPSPFKEVSQSPLIPCGDCINVLMHVYSWHDVSSILFCTSHFLTIVPQFLVLSIMQKGLHQTEALAAFLQSSKQAYVELNPAASLDDAEADQIIQELRAELRL
jgi:hypothetical protein